MATKNNKKFIIESIALIFFAIILGTTTLYNADTNTIQYSNIVYSFNIDDIPTYTSTPYVIINNNIPYFSEADYTTNPFEKYSQLDSLGRCGVAYANICKEIMPNENEERETIGSIKPSGWQTIRYNELIDGNYLISDRARQYLYVHIGLLQFLKELILLQMVFKWKLILLKIMVKVFALMYMFIMFSHVSQ